MKLAILILIPACAAAGAAVTALLVRAMLLTHGEVTAKVLGRHMADFSAALATAETRLHDLVTRKTLALSEDVSSLAEATRAAGETARAQPPDVPLTPAPVAAAKPAARRAAKTEGF